MHWKDCTAFPGAIETDPFPIRATLETIELERRSPGEFWRIDRQNSPDTDASSKNHSPQSTDANLRHYLLVRDFRKKSSSSAEELSISTMKLSTLLVK